MNKINRTRIKKIIAVVMSVLFVMITACPLNAYVADTEVQAVFYLLKEGGSRTDYRASNYTKLGKGTLKNPVKLYGDE